jgi:hypothetical protein
MENNPLLRWIRLAQVGAADVSQRLGAGIVCSCARAGLAARIKAAATPKIQRDIRFIALSLLKLL